MSDLEQDLLALQADDIDDIEPGDDLALFKRAEFKKKKRKKNKVFKEIDTYLDDGFSGDDDMAFITDLKIKKKDKVKADGDLFDTAGDAKKKFKNVEAKFKPEIAHLQKLLKDNEDASQTIRSVLKPLLTSKARGSSKLLADLLLALNSSNNNRLAVVKEMTSVKKAIYDLKIKLERDNKDEDLGLPSDQFGAKMFDELYKMGRSKVLAQANQYNTDMSAFVSPDNSAPPVDNYDDFIDERLSTENNSYRSPDGNKMIEYENRHPETCIQKSFSTGDLTVVAIDDTGVVLDDDPVPDIDSLGKLTFNNDSGTCSDSAGRVYKVIEVA